MKEIDLSKIPLNKKTDFIFESEVLGFFNRLAINMRVVINSKEYKQQRKELKKALKYYFESEI